MTSGNRARNRRRTAGGNRPPNVQRSGTGGGRPRSSSQVQRPTSGTRQSMTSRRGLKSSYDFVQGGGTYQGRVVNYGGKLYTTKTGVFEGSMSREVVPSKGHINGTGGGNGVWERIRQNYANMQMAGQSVMTPIPNNPSTWPCPTSDDFPVPCPEGYWCLNGMCTDSGTVAGGPVRQGDD